MKKAAPAKHKKFNVSQYKRITAPAKGDLNKIIDLITDKKIGKGVYRDVYLYKHNPDFVVKIERNPSDYANVTEWMHYINSRHTPFRKLLAPCEIINQTGSILIQRRVTHEGNYPKRLPGVFTDIKKSNFGFIDGKFVCCDYAFLLLGVPFKLKRVSWKRN